MNHYVSTEHFVVVSYTILVRNSVANTSMKVIWEFIQFTVWVRRMDSVNGIDFAKGIRQFLLNI
jgi:hypothetical protein